MENIPRIIDTVRLQAAIPVPSFLLDHHVEGRAVLPAVKAMQVIGDAVKRYRPDADITNMTRTRFDKFLLLHSGNARIDALVDIDTYDNGDIGARLLTKNQIKNASMTRIKEHASVYYPRDRAGAADRPHDAPVGLFSDLGGNCARISSERIYEELVPFGPCFHSIQGNILISEQGVIESAATPAACAGLRLPGESPEDFSFALDAAYHGACVWGQRYAGMVAFPVGFAKRTIWQPTRAGKSYVCRILPVQTAPDLLVFDLWIADETGAVFESSRGVRMKDVSAGRMKPPLWITAEGKSGEP